MSAAPDDERAGEVERTKELRLPPVPGRPAPPILADQPTDQLPPPGPRDPTRGFGPWMPLQPRVVPRPRQRSRVPFVLAAVVLLVVLAGVVVVAVYGG